MKSMNNIPDMSPRWLQLLSQPKKKPKLQPLAQHRPTSPGTTPWGRARLDALAQEVLHAQVGTRNHTLNKAAFLSGQAVAGGHIEEHDAVMALISAAMAAGLREAEARKTIQSGVLSGAKSPTGPVEKDARIVPRKEEPERKETHVIVQGEPWAAIDAGARWLARHPAIYSRQGRLATISELDENVALHNATVPAGACQITDITLPRAWDCISQVGTYLAWNKQARAEVPIDPPMQITAAVLARGQWDGARELRGISRAPLIHADGAIFDRHGYDSDTGMFFAKCGEIEMPTAPTKDDAVAAVDVLLDAIRDFPVRSPVDAAGWLAALLTVATRHLYPTVPLFVIDASTPGSGKTLLTTLISTIAMGGPPASVSWSKEEDEFRKASFSLLLSGVPMVVVDNVPSGSAVGSATLDMLLTSTHKTDRILGKSVQGTVPNNATWFYTGNNVSIKGDTGRRAIVIRLETEDERPELRTGFAHPQIVEWAMRERPRLLGAALTIVSAYLRAGSPDSGVRALGSFERWSEVVASALVWVGQPDPTQLLAASHTEADPYTSAHIGLLEALSEHKHPLTARQMLEACEADDALRCAILELCPARGDALPSTRSLGHRLRALKDRAKTISKGMCKLCTKYNRTKTIMWFVSTRNTPQPTHESEELDFGF